MKAAVWPAIVPTVKELGGTHIFLLADDNTFEAAGKRAKDLLCQAGLSLHGRVFPGTPVLVPDERTVGSALAAMEPEDDLILAVGPAC